MSAAPASESKEPTSPDGDRASLLQHVEVFVAHARSDVHAVRFFDNGNDKSGYKPVHRPFDTELLRHHLEGGPHLGAYFIGAGSNVTRLAGLDLDDHAGTSNWGKMSEVAARLRDTGKKLGLEAWPVLSGSGNGIHLLYRWDDPQAADAVRDQLMHILATAGLKDGRSGVEKGEVEVFPKQGSVPVGGLGNLLAVPFGRKSVPLDAGLQPIAVPLPWISSAPVPPIQPAEVNQPFVGADPETVREALKYLNADDYDLWIRSGLALKHSLGDAGFDLWDEWSKNSSKYPAPSAITILWDRFKPRPDGVTLGTVFHLAREAGWQGKPGRPSNRPVIEVRGGELVEIVNQAASALREADTGIYQRGGELVRAIKLDRAVGEDDAVRREAGSTVLIRVIEAWLVEQMAKHAHWTKTTILRDGTLKVACVDPPPRYARTLMARQGEWLFPALRGVLTAPTLGRDGRIVQCPGYDPASGLLLDFKAGSFPDVPDTPTKEDAQAALEQFVGRADQTKRGILRGFPFANQASKSVALSAFLAGLVRPMGGSIPLHAFDAPAAGTGKSKLAEMVGLLATGHKPPAMSQGKSSEEDEKRLSTVLHAGDAVILIDNCELPLEGDFLCSMLTQEKVQARILGLSERRILPCTALVLATGNNLSFHGDISRRAVICRLDAKMERPDSRKFDFDAQMDLVANRAALVVAALTAMRAYLLASDKPKLTSVGSFPDWDLIRGTLIWCGYADPADTRNAVLDEDPRKTELTEIMDLWDRTFRVAGSKVTVAMIGKRGFQDPLCLALANATSARNGQWNAKSVGRWLRRNKDRVAGGRVFRRLNDRQWTMEKVQPPEKW